MQNDFLTERDKASLRLEYMNAALQRAKKMPDLKELLGEKRGMTHQEMAAILRGKPVYEQREHTKAT